MWIDDQPNEKIIKINIPTNDLLIIDKLTEDQIFGILSCYNKKYINYSHNHHEFENNLDKFLTLPQKQMEKLTYTYLKSCEDFAFYLYSGTANYWSFNLIPDYIIDKDNTIENIFDEWYINMLKSLLKTIRCSEHDDKSEENRVSINGIDIDNEKFYELVNLPTSTQKITINKRILNTFFTLFLRNSLELIGNGNWHRGWWWIETKNVSIEIDDNYIRMTDIPIKEFYSKDMKEYRAKAFEEKHVLDWPLDFKNKTIRTFYEMIKMLNKYGYNYKFNCGFNEDLNFFLELKF